MADDIADGGSDIKIVFTPSGRQGHVPAGTTVLQAARTLGVDIDLSAVVGPCVVAARWMLALANLPSTASPRAQTACAASPRWKPAMPTKRALPTGVACPASQSLYPMW